MLSCHFHHHIHQNYHLSPHHNINFNDKKQLELGGIHGDYWLFPHHFQIADVMLPKFIILRMLCADKSIFQARSVAQKHNLKERTFLNLSWVKEDPLGTSPQKIVPLVRIKK